MVALECGGLLGVRLSQGAAAVPRLVGGGVSRDEYAQLSGVRMAPVKCWNSGSRRSGVCVGGSKRSSGRENERAKRGMNFCVQVAASAYPPIAQTEKTFRLPIDYYQILGAEPQYLADAVMRAFESRVNNPPREGFSQQALLARLEILRGARDSLVDPVIRAEYNQGLAEDEADTLILDVPWTKVGGALCLLHEVREVEVVLQAGQALLAQQEDLPTTLHRDVVFAMALSYVELSREAMSEVPPAVVKSCSLLESALKVLREVSGRVLVPDLQEQIEATLDELAPRCILELLALPLDKEHEAQREQGLQGLRALLWTVDGDGDGSTMAGLTREQLMKEAFSFMTAAEQVAFFSTTPSDVPADGSEVYVAALAHVAEGFASKEPRLIQKADSLFRQLQQNNGSLTNNEPSDPQFEFAFERGICALLLGEVADCRTWLGLEDESSPFRDPSIVNYVYAFSEEGEEADSLPGLCKLLEGWLMEIVFPRFRDIESFHVRLNDYFDDPSVLSYLEGLEKGTGSHMAAAAAIVKIGAGAGAALKATLKKVFPIGGSNESFITSAFLEYPVELPKRDFQQFVAHRGTDGDPGFNGYAVDFEGENWEGSENELEDGTPGKARSSFDEGPVRRSFGPIQIASSGLVFGALVMAGLHFLPIHPRVARLLESFASVGYSAHVPNPSATVISTTGVREKEAVEVEVPKMDARLAERMVRKWQAAKARALGPTHDMSALPEVLEGEMLKCWTDRASDVKRNGWSWEYTLLNLNIDILTVSDDGRRATAEATLQEAAHLVDINNPEHNDSYRDTYTARYDLRHGLNGWRICGGAVLRT